MQRGGSLKKYLLIFLLASFFLTMSSLSFAKVEKGMTGAEVQNVQYMLIDAGYLSDGADGVFGSGTESAVRRFQADHGLDADGVVGAQTLSALTRSDSVATDVVSQPGDSSGTVSDIQRRLSNNGYSTVGVDGVYGNGTAQAVRAFQESQGINATGVVDLRTKRALYALGNGNRNNSDGVGSYQKRMVMDATAYTAHDPGNSGYTANGNRLVRGLVSVDPNVIPLGTRLYIEGYGYAVADDTGGAINGDRIDLGMDSRTEANNFGRQNVVVYVL